MMTAEEFIKLKQKLKKELSRRNGNGSVSEFADPKYDFNENDRPVSREVIMTEQGQKVIDLALKINDVGNLKNVEQGDLVSKDIELLDSTITKWSQESMTGSTSSCKTSCTGLCISSCSGGCTGCGGSCSYGCSGGCWGSCSSTCADDCTGGCTRTCGAGCGHDCTYDCTGTARAYG